MSEMPLDREVLAKIGAETLMEHGYSSDVLKQWRRRGISWKERPTVKDLAIKKGVSLPVDFDKVQRVPKAPRKRPATKKRRVA